VINSQPIKLRRQATTFTQIPAPEPKEKSRRSWPADDSAVDALVGESANVGESTNKDAWAALRDKLRGEQNLIIIFGSRNPRRSRQPGEFRLRISGAKFICLADYANSRGAADMGLYPDLLPGYHPVAGNSSSIRSGEKFRNCRPRSVRKWSKREKSGAS
jgi:NADH-quinone oxidoreductase subunit G